MRLGAELDRTNAEFFQTQNLRGVRAQGAETRFNIAAGAQTPGNNGAQGRQTRLNIGAQGRQTLKHWCSRCADSPEHWRSGQRAGLLAGVEGEKQRRYRHHW